MAHTNRKLAPDVDTVFFMTAIEHAYLSSSLVKEIAQFGGDVSGMVPAAVLRRLRRGQTVGYDRWTCATPCDRIALPSTSSSSSSGSKR